MEMPIKIYLGTRDGKNLSVVPEGYPGATEYVHEEAVKSLLRELNKALHDKEEQMKIQKEQLLEEVCDYLGQYNVSQAKRFGPVNRLRVADYTIDIYAFRKAMED